MRGEKTIKLAVNEWPDEVKKAIEKHLKTNKKFLLDLSLAIGTGESTGRDMDHSLENRRESSISMKDTIKEALTDMSKKHQSLKELDLTKAKVGVRGIKNKYIFVTAPRKVK